jgi:hypothetical protein
MSRDHKKKRSGKLILFVIYAILAVYMLNLSLSFINLPNFFSDIQNWLFLIAGVFLGLGAFRVLVRR